MTPRKRSERRSAVCSAPASRCVKACVFLQRYGSYPKQYVRQNQADSLILSPGMGYRASKTIIHSCTLCGSVRRCAPTISTWGMCASTRVASLSKRAACRRRSTTSPYTTWSRPTAWSSRLSATNPDRRQRVAFDPGRQLPASRPREVRAAYEAPRRSPRGRRRAHAGLLRAPAAWLRSLAASTLDRSARLLGRSRQTAG